MVGCGAVNSVSPAGEKYYTSVDKKISNKYFMSLNVAQINDALKNEIAFLKIARNECGSQDVFILPAFSYSAKRDSIYSVAGNFVVSGEQKEKLFGWYYCNPSKDQILNELSNPANKKQIKQRCADISTALSEESSYYAEVCSVVLSP